MCSEENQTKCQVRYLCSGQVNACADTGSCQGDHRLKFGHVQMCTAVWYVIPYVFLCLVLHIWELLQAVGNLLCAVLRNLHHAALVQVVLASTACL
jgi:hypothetical protein